VVVLINETPLAGDEALAATVGAGGGSFLLFYSETPGEVAGKRPRGARRSADTTVR
jgi:hypothetical protein